MTYTLEQLSDFHAICALKYRYARALDTQDWTLLETCFAPDVALWPGGEGYVAKGREAVMDLVKSLAIDSFYSSHIVSQPEIEFIDADHAKGIWRLNDVLLFTAPHPAITHMPIEGGEASSSASIYYDEYVRINDEWRISSSGYRRIYEIVDRPGADRSQLVTYAARGLATES